MNNLVRIAALAALVALASGPSALAQSAPSTGGVSVYDISQSGVSISQNGLSLGVDPEQGVSLGVDAGENGGLTVGAGPQGVSLDVRDNAGSGSTPAPGTQSPAPSSSSSPSSSPPSGGAAQPDRTPAGPGGAVAASPRRATGRGSTSTGADPAAGATRSEARRASAARERRARSEAAAARDEPRGVAPVLDFIEEIPRAVWAGLVALALIATAMWMLWVRGRRRLERNAWVDTESGAMNIVAFETLLAQEWARSVRYRRPLGLLLLELEELAPGGGRRPLTGRRLADAREAITERARDADTVAQLSPTRIAVICPESPRGSVETLAHALERSLEVEQVHARVGMGERLETDRGPADLVSRTAAGLHADSFGEPPAASAAEAPTLQHAAA